MELCAKPRCKTSRASLKFKFEHVYLIDCEFFENYFSSTIRKQQKKRRNK